VVLAAYADTYLAHADPTQDVGDGFVHHLDPVHPLQQQKGIVGDLLRLIREFNDLSEQEILEPHNNLTPLLKAGVATEITKKKAQIWDLDRFSALSLTCTDEFFFEALASNIKGSVISFQTFTKRLANLKQSRIVQRLNVLKESYVINQDEIAALENELNSIVNAEVLIKVKSMKLFSCINSEKPTPIFLKGPLSLPNQLGRIVSSVIMKKSIKNRRTILPVIVTASKIFLGLSYLTTRSFQIQS
jgi:hypothetical protein